jgi:hypothetical protein
MAAERFHRGDERKIERVALIATMLCRLLIAPGVFRSTPIAQCIDQQDHRAIKRRCASMMGFKSFYNASIALAGVELGSSDSKAPVLVRSRTASSPVNENHVGDGEGVKRRPRKTAVSS